MKPFCGFKNWENRMNNFQSWSWETLLWTKGKIWLKYASCLWCTKMIHFCFHSAPLLQPLIMFHLKLLLCIHDWQKVVLYPRILFTWRYCLYKRALYGSPFSIPKLKVQKMIATIFNQKFNLIFNVFLYFSQTDSTCWKAHLVANSPLTPLTVSSTLHQKILALTFCLCKLHMFCMDNGNVKVPSRYPHDSLTSMDFADVIDNENGNIIPAGLLGGSNSILLCSLPKEKTNLDLPNKTTHTSTWGRCYHICSQISFVHYSVWCPWEHHQ